MDVTLRSRYESDDLPVTPAPPSVQRDKFHWGPTSSHFGTSPGHVIMTLFTLACTFLRTYESQNAATWWRRGSEEKRRVQYVQENGEYIEDGQQLHSSLTPFHKSPPVPSRTLLTALAWSQADLKGSA